MTGCLNKIILIGNLSGDPEIRYTDLGISVCNFNIGVRENRKINNEWSIHTEWFKIVCFGKLAENSNKYLKKGKQVYLEGKIQLKTWKKNNDTFSACEVIASRLIFLGSKDENNLVSKNNLENNIEVPHENNEAEEQFLF